MTSSRVRKRSGCGGRPWDSSKSIHQRFMALDCAIRQDMLHIHSLFRKRPRHKQRPVTFKRVFFHAKQRNATLIRLSNQEGNAIAESSDIAARSYETRPSGS